MDSSISNLTQSVYFTPAFNAAIFDGLIRIYFTQYQEPVGLRIYFYLKENLQVLFNESIQDHKTLGKNVFIMIYPNEESFNLSFGVGGVGLVKQDVLGQDEIIGLIGNLNDDILKELSYAVSEILNEWHEEVLNEPQLIL